MNKKTYVLIALALVLLIGGYFAWNWLKTAETPEQIQEEETTFRVVAGDKFEINVPSTWKEVLAPEGIKLYVVNQDEEIIDPVKEKEAFKSYLAVTYDVKGGKNLGEFVDYVKGLLAGQIEDITFSEGQTTVINGLNAITVEASITQEGYTFKTLLAILEGEGEDIWTMSLNTSDVRWNQVKDIFYQVAESFKLKINEEAVQE